MYSCLPTTKAQRGKAKGREPEISPRYTCIYVYIYVYIYIYVKRQPMFELPYLPSPSIPPTHTHTHIQGDPIKRLRVRSARNRTERHSAPPLGSACLGEGDDGGGGPRLPGAGGQQRLEIASEFRTFRATSRVQKRKEHKKKDHHGRSQSLHHVL